MPVRMNSQILLYILDFNELRITIITSVAVKQDWWSEEVVINYEKAIKGLTGIVFMVLGITILNYGTKLETAISEQASSTSSSSRRK